MTIIVGMVIIIFFDGSKWSIQTATGLIIFFMGILNLID